MMNQRTLPAIFIDKVKRKGKSTFLICKKEGQWHHVSWNQVGEKVKLLTLGLIALGVRKNDRVAAISETRPELAYCCLAIANAAAIFTPIYHTNSPEECAHVLKDSGAQIAFAQNQGQCLKLREASRKNCPLDKIIVFEKYEHSPDNQILNLDQLCEIGKDELSKHGDRAYMDRILSVKPEDVTAIIYTSGTTGAPKGVVETNDGIIRNLQEYTKFFPVLEDDRSLSFLPMAHALELRNGHWCHIIYGFPQVYAQSIQTLFADIHETGPTFFFTTPRFFEKYYTTIQTNLEKSAGWKKTLYGWCLKKGDRYQAIRQNAGRKLSHIADILFYILADCIYLKRVRKMVGKTIRYAGVGGAPMAPEMLSFFCACGLPLYEGYGMTEARGMLSVNRPGATKIGTVGKPLDGVELQFTEDSEILARGWVQGNRYWNNAKATQELYENGWLHTGDLGFMDEDGFLHLTGRKKEILITSSGKNISPSYIENLLKMSRYISQAVVFGEGKTYLTALVTLNQEETIKFAHDNHIKYSDFKDLTKKQEILDLIHGEIEKRNRDLARIEQIRKYTILEDELRQDLGEVTPTFKVKRKVINQRYKDRIEAMYVS